MPTGEGVAFPIASFDTFTTYSEPANLQEAENTIGPLLSARQHIEEKGRWITLMTEASILLINKRPTPRDPPAPLQRKALAMSVFDAAKPRSFKPLSVCRTFRPGRA